MIVKKIALPLMAILMLGSLFAGCTQPAGTVPLTTIVPEPTPSPTQTVTTAATTVPQPVVTLVRYVSQKKDIWDPDLMFALQVPVEWNVSTYQLMRTDTPDYRTDLAADTVCSVYSYYFSQNKDKAYREQVRQWSPPPIETTVTINGITYDRFESPSAGMTRVSYIMRGSSANERGYASVLFYSADTRNRFEKEDFERVIASFRYFPGTFAGRMPGEGIPRVLSPMIASPGINSRSGSGDSESTGGSSGCSRCGI